MMSDCPKDEILKRIQQLSVEDRLLLDEQLAALSEAEWSREVKGARREARARGLDQAAITRAIAELRARP